MASTVHRTVLTRASDVRRRWLVVAALLLAAMVLVTSQVRRPDRRAVGPLSTLVLGVLAPAQGVLARGADAVVRFWRLYTEIGRLRAENTRLREEVERLSGEMGRLREQAQATQRLERLLAFRQQLPGRALGARVIGRDSRAWFSVVLVDRGLRDGVRRNDPVVAAEGLVGRVLTVTASTAQVLLVSDPRSAVGAVLQQSREAGVVEGQGQGLLRLKYISRAREIPLGEAVVTSGHTGLFPRGIPVGTVVSVIREQAALYQEALIRPAVSLDHLEEVLILIEGGADR
ncbi:MAG: rod shape-determining protein MreC [Armatimonadota bacterium]|nr:rod shape-determining protein MreC [Armatimonadota bacterium]MDR7533972.1 rod shape-determining protein MreC [Armatimonadota bacterium]MDR7536440.1 rod shape-determining protein MreC [Armatimonadota bacterium]